MSEVENNTPQINNEGEPVNVITDYQVHTVSLVKGCALGRNFVKLKSQSAPDEGGIPLETQEKLNKAKALDAEAAEAATAKGAEAEEQAPEAVVEGEDALASVGVEVVTEVTGGEEEAVEEEQSGDEPEVAPEVVAEEVGVEAVKEAEAPVEKAKMFTVAELGEVTKASLEAMGAMFKDISAKAPEANQWEIYDLMQQSMWAVDDAMWYEKQALQDQIWNEVWNEVESRVNKAKALKVVEATDPVDAMKAFEEANPAMAKLLKAEIETSKAKAREAEEATKVEVRAKALEQGAVTFKRLATDDNTTEAIVDALAAIQVAAPEAHTVVSKALSTASGILLGGELFTDLGSGEPLVQQTETEFVAAKAKSLVDQKAAEGVTLNIAAARATVRQTEEFAALYA